MQKKKFVSVAILLIAFILLVVLVQGCNKKPLDSKEPSLSYCYRFNVTYNGQPVSSAEIIGIYKSTEDTLIVCNENGQANLISEHPLFAVCGFAPGLSSVVNLDHDGDIAIALEKVQQNSDTISHYLKPTGTYWFGIYDSDSHGDVRFRYLYNFVYFYCSSWLPGWPFGDPNPNHWDSWNLTDFPYPWKGKKLLVPRTYQYWHRVVYGYSINRALFLIATS